MRLEMVRRPCPLCGSTDEGGVFAEANVDPAGLDALSFSSRKTPEYMHYRLIACPTCDALYASPVPASDGLSGAYRDAAFDSQEEAGYASRTYGRLLRRILPGLPDLSGALDIGTGDGAFLAELIEAGFTGVQGVEPSSAPIALAPPAIRPLIRQGLFRPEDFRAAAFSLVTCFQTMEHLSDPLAVCRGAFGLLKPGGMFFFISHDWRALPTRVLGRRSPIFDIEHLQLLSRRSAAFLLQRAGFADVTIRRVMNCYPLHYWVKLFPFPRRLKRRLVPALKAAGVGHLPLPMPAGNLAVVGRKPAGGSAPPRETALS